MSWLSAALTDNAPTNAVNDLIKTLCGVSPCRNWSFLENVPAGTLVNQIQTITLSNWSGTNTIKFTYNAHESSAVTYASDVTAAIQAALIALSDFGTSSPADLTVARTSATVYTVTFGAANGRFQGVDMLPITCTSGTGAPAASGVVEVTTAAWNSTNAAAYSMDVFKCAGTGNDANSAAQDLYLGIERRSVSEIQTINLTSWSTGDTFKLTYNAHETSAITFSSDNSADIQAALEALTDFAPGDLTVTKAYHSPTNALTASYRVLFSDTGAFKFVDVSAITVTTAVGCAGSVAETVKGGTDEVWAGSSVALEYSTVYKKFRKVVPIYAGYSAGTLTVDANGYGVYTTSYTPDQYLTPAAIIAWSTGWSMTLNKTGFTYQIKMTHDFMLLVTKVGATERMFYSGLMDSMVDAGVGDTYPFVSWGSASMGQGVGGTTSFGGFVTLPGVGAQANLSGLFGAKHAFWTGNCISTVTSNASNANDRWQQNKIHVGRVLLFHPVAAASIYIYGFARGLLKSDLLMINTGGTVSVGDTMSIGGTTYTCVGPAKVTTPEYLFSPAT